MLGRWALARDSSPPCGELSAAAFAFACAHSLTAYMCLHASPATVLLCPSFPDATRRGVSTWSTDLLGVNGSERMQLGMLVDLSGQGMGLRCKRFMLVVEGGKVTHTKVGDKVDLVSADAAEKVLSMKAGAGAAAGGEGEGPRKGGLLEKLLGREVAERAAEAENSESGDLLPVSRDDMRRVSRLLRGGRYTDFWFPWGGAGELMRSPRFH